MDSVLQQVADAPTLSRTLSAQWISQVDDDIRTVKSRIHNRITRDKVIFDQHLAASKSIKSKLTSLTRDVDALAHAVTDPKGLVAGLTASLSQNRTVQQDALDTLVLSNAVTHLLTCARTYQAAADYSRAGHLGKAASSCLALLEELDSSPDPLSSSRIAWELKAKVETMQHSIQEQLAKYLACCVNVQPSQRRLTIQSAHLQLSLHEICSFIDRSALSSHLAALRKDLLTHFVEPILQHSASLTIGHSSDADTVSVDVVADPSHRLQNLTTLLRFLHDHYVPNLPKDVSVEFTASLYEPIASAVLHRFIETSSPSSIDELPAFITSVQSAVAFETSIATDFAVSSGRERMISDWACKLPTFYERQRRQHFLQEARSSILTSSNDSVRIDIPPHAHDTEEHTEDISDASALPSAATQTSLPQPLPPATSEESFDNTWDFEASETPATGRTSVDSWGFEDDDVQEELGKQQPGAPSEHSQGESVHSEEDSSNGWGWDDDDEQGDIATEDDDAWESSWADPAPVQTKPPASAPAQVEHFDTISSPSKPKAATRLEKKFAKAKGQHIPITPLSANPVGAKSFSSSQHDAFRSEPVSTQLSPAILPSTLKAARKPPKKETFMVSQCALTIFDIANRVLAEGKELSMSTIFDAQITYRAGATLLQAASSVFDMFRAVLPVKDVPPFGGSTAHALLFSNDCLHLAHAVLQLSHEQEWETFASDPDKLRGKDLLEDVASRLQECGERWFESTLDKRKSTLLDVLSAADGFVYVGDAEQFLECKMIVEQLVKDISRLSKDWKPILSKSSHYTAVGVLVDGVLTEMINQIIRLDDIPEMESRHLGQLCRLLSPLEDLFCDSPGESSTVVVHVSSWLKFSYLSELLEASLTDISYLFDEGALIDFDTNELTKLIRALFADTPLRANAIARITGGNTQQ